ncbi:hypothetical protein OR263_32350 [Streptomyces sp. NEAU-H22]|uniref:hypothetical protein n=1 Tax=unclassified Streptomyces TaxID=2593676 RepID=UPI002250F7F4|nr:MULTISPECIES: hypothetical protein [unclassified Streptomyces]MCX3291348.1 hypothetical protein [Streptomyces sp. NEAU-H22]WMD03161.1 hypothetical protein Q7C01_01645 [Streptomyces sp. FXY-T5]
MTTLRGGHTAEFDRPLLPEAVRAELAKADHRANLTLATLGAALAALLTAITAGVITPTQYATIPQLLLWTGCAACAPSLVLLSLATRPQPTPTTDTPPQLLTRTTRVKHRRIRQAMTWGAAFLTLTLAGTLAGLLS